MLRSHSAKPVSERLQSEILKLKTEGECRQVFELVRQQYRNIQRGLSAKVMGHLAVGSEVVVDFRGRQVKTVVKKINITTVQVEIDGVTWVVPAAHVKPVRGRKHGN